MTTEEAFQVITKLTAWATNHPSWLSESTDFSQGYKAGITQAQSIVLNIINEKSNKID